MSQTNFPNATDAEWTTARRIIYRAAVRAGYEPNTAEDMAQNGMKRILTSPYESQRPETLRQAAGWLVGSCRRWGWQSLMAPSDRPRGRFPDETARAVTFQTMAVYRRRSGNLSPLAAAALAELHRISPGLIRAVEGSGCDAEVAAEVAERMAG